MRMARYVTILTMAGGVIGALADVPVPPLERRVTDLVGVLNVAQRQQTEDRLAQFEARKGAQVAVLIVPSTAPETIEQYGIRVASTWKLGRKGVDDGALLLVATQDRALRIEVGYGLEGVLPDAICKRIIDEVIVPQFKNGDLAGGIEAGVGRILSVADGEPLPEPRFTTIRTNPGPWIPYAVFGAIILGQILRVLLGRLWGSLVGGGVAGVVAGVVFGALIPALFFGFIVFLMTMGNGRGGHGGVSYGSGSWSGGSSGGGGFSGGGGSFGGGGASGRW